ncbi:MAG: hypothetical protein PHP04_11725 [Bacteroidales bacterium]|nr:hypothetical protein [Bacteroidales bacterium]HNW73331.1 hypothetical protein [Bacteroidales bacterium]HPS50855.1 hypothetical protein [Bacteroidales bacterium]
MSYLINFLIALGLIRTVSNLLNLLKQTKDAVFRFAQDYFFKLPYKGWMSLVASALPFILVIVLSQNANGETIRSEPVIALIATPFLFPFRLNNEPIKRLLVADVKDDAEYEGIEPQLFDNGESGKGLRILMYRKDKKVDVYWQPGVRPGLQNLSIGDGIGDTAECVMSPSRFEMTGSGVYLDIVFTDKLGRRVRIYIRENNSDFHPVPFLAPVGSNVKSPNKLFAVYMKEFDFVKRQGTEINLKIGNRELTPATFPLPMNGQRVYFIRYATNLVIGEINSLPTKPVIIENVRPGINKIDDLNLTIDDDGRIKECWVDQGNDPIGLKFEPGFPNLLALPRDKKIQGQWQYAVSSKVLFGGTYTLQRDQDKVTVELDVTQPWKPGKLPFTYRLLTIFIRSFRTWPTTYKWTGTVDLKNNIIVNETWVRK